MCQLWGISLIVTYVDMYMAYLNGFVCRDIMINCEISFSSRKLHLRGKYSIIVGQLTTALFVHHNSRSICNELPMGPVVRWVIGMNLAMNCHELAAPKCILHTHDHTNFLLKGPTKCPT